MKFYVRKQLNLSLLNFIYLTCNYFGDLTVGFTRILNILKQLYAFYIVLIEIIYLIITFEIILF